MTEELSWLKDTYITHRGYHSPEKAPENSMAAFTRAVEEGFGIELDIHLTKDQQVVVFHDDDLERMTGYTKKITDCTWGEIRSLTLLNTQEKIPLLKEVLYLIDGRVPLLIEIKNRGKVGKLEEKTDELLRGYKGEFAIQSFNPYSVGWFKEHSPEIIRGQLSGVFKEENLPMYKKFLLKNLLMNHVSKPHFINYDIDYLSKIPVRIHRKKGSILLGYTAKDPQAYQQALEKTINVVFEGFNPKELTKDDSGTE
ncbi:glycerophosphodiester phosphodiesterase family protein [Isachenkonia alkalipeptolytica]|uniref:Glycerophosphodiester phosphodiesterase n=1 Tax=Isachenkonia alkalipeptolytica TaxID=2565777 RepID=A0AA43XJ19_9CLOT|nr:glycerophosphodiester phosphodiesterase family protein [Isachenkonia alkalipeptolytica]NBG87129.1 glycerophosphodiester phosphodiesterase [Isachenkonia alkalipeptolytica]